MLVIYKGNIVLKISLEGAMVRLQPVVGRFDNLQLLQTLARNEELLAQVYISQLDTKDIPTVITRYFGERGWMVRTPGEAPAHEGSPWAES